MERNYQCYTGKIWNKLDDAYRSYKIFTADIYLLKN